MAGCRPKIKKIKSRELEFLLGENGVEPSRRWKYSQRIKKGAGFNQSFFNYYLML